MEEVQEKIEKFPWINESLNSEMVFPILHGKKNSKDQ